MEFMEGNIITSRYDLCNDCYYDGVCNNQMRLLDNATQLSELMDYTVVVQTCEDFKEIIL